MCVCIIYSILYSHGYEIKYHSALTVIIENDNTYFNIILTPNSESVHVYKNVTDN